MPVTRGCATVSHHQTGGRRALCGGQRPRDASIASLIGLLTVAAWMLGYDTPLTALDEGLGALGVSAAWLGDADGSVNYGDENGRAAGRVVGHVLAWRAAFRRRPRGMQLLLAVEV